MNAFVASRWSLLQVACAPSICDHASSQVLVAQLEEEGAIAGGWGTQRESKHAMERGDAIVQEPAERISFSVRFPANLSQRCSFQNCIPWEEGHFFGQAIGFVSPVNDIFTNSTRDCLTKICHAPGSPFVVVYIGILQLAFFVQWVDHLISLDR